jgi:hypothetical protein
MMENQISDVRLGEWAEGEISSAYSPTSITSKRI